MKRYTSWSLVLIFATVSPLLSQIGGGVLKGIVSDPSGAAVPRASVSIKGLSTGNVRTSASTTAGFYEAVNLPVGEYSVTVSAPAFSTAERTSIVVRIGADT